MAYLSKMIYRGGVMSPKPENYRVVMDMEELLAAVTEGFWSHDCESAKAQLLVPEVKEYCATRQKAVQQQEQIDNLINDDVPEVDLEEEILNEQLSEKLPTLEEQFKERFNKNALIDRGPFKGQECKAFKAFKKAHGGE